MSRFNQAVSTGTRSAIATLPDRAVTHQGGTGFTRDTRSELFLLAVSSMVSEKGNFYETGNDQYNRFVSLLHSVAEDTEWCIGFVKFLRTVANMRSASIVAAAEITRARLTLAQGATTQKSREALGSRHVISAALQRPDEPGELLGYWKPLYGTPFPKPVKRGVADAVDRMWNEKAWLKWDGESKGWRFADVLQMCRPKTEKQWQNTLFKHVLNQRYGADELPNGLPVVQARAQLMALPVPERKNVTAGQLAEAGMTWEALAGWLQGPLDAAAWEKIIPSMGAMALTRNLRNFDQAGISRIAKRAVEDKLSSAEEIRRSRQLPMRFLSAYRAINTSGTVTGWGPVLEEAINLSLSNVPELSGRTLVLVDLSGSMYGATLSDKSGLRFVDAAAIFGAAVAKRAQHADLYGFGWEPKRFDFTTRYSLLPLAELIVSTKTDARNLGYGIVDGLGGTETVKALQETFRPGFHDRIVIVTDEQFQGGYWNHTNDVDTFLIKANVPSYTWNLAGYKAAQAQSGSQKRHTFGGLSDNSFRMIPLIEAGQHQNWNEIFGQS